jgi:hypothetical protein
MHVGQSVLAALIAERQACMIDPAEMQHGGLHVMDVDRVGNDVPGEVVGLAINGSRFDAAAGHPPAVSAAEMIAAFGICRITLPERCATELAAPDDERIIQHAAFLQVLHECRGWTFGIDTLLFKLSEQIAVLIPAGMHQLHKANSTFQQASSNQAVVGERALDQSIGAIAIQSRFGLAGKIDQIRDARLHPKRHLILSNSGVDFRITIIRQMLPGSWRQCHPADRAAIPN